MMVPGRLRVQVGTVGRPLWGRFDPFATPPVNGRYCARGCVKTPAPFHADLFCSLFRVLRTFRIKKTAKNFALLGQPQKFAAFSHSLGRFYLFVTPSGNDRYLRIAVVHCLVFARQRSPTNRMRRGGWPAGAN